MLHCEIKQEIDGTVTASSPELTLIIIPDGKNKGKAFNRNFVRQQVGGTKLHAILNNIAARIQQEKITTEQAQEEVVNLVKTWEKPEHERVLVGELNGVRVYIQDDSIVMTTKDLHK